MTFMVFKHDYLGKCVHLKTFYGSLAVAKAYAEEHFGFVMQEVV